MKKTVLFLMSALVFMAMGCSSGDDEREAPTPPSPSDSPSETIVIEPGTDVRPDWVAPDATDYEQNMNVYLTMQDELLSYLSENDLLCAKIDGEVRGVAVPRLEEGEWLISMILFSNGAAPVQLSYYCDKLHRIFTIDWTTFDATVPPTGDSVTYYPKFVEE